MKGTGVPFVDHSVQSLVDLCIADDEAAMRALVDRYRDRVFGLCFRMLGQWHDAEDVAQETFVRALRHLRQWDRSRDFEPWLFAIAGNRCRTFLSKRARRPVTQPLLDDLLDKTTSSQHTGQLNEELFLALSSMRAEHRQAFLLYHQQQLSYDDIAAALGRPAGTVKTWVHRARRSLLRFFSQRQTIEVTEHALR
jgi:RNA polymerase sigma-70 factor (ECF subfamily)